MFKYNILNEYSFKLNLQELGLPELYKIYSKKLVYLIYFKMSVIFSDKYTFNSFKYIYVKKFYWNNVLI